MLQAGFKAVISQSQFLQGLQFSQLGGKRGQFVDMQIEASQALQLANRFG